MERLSTGKPRRIPCCDQRQPILVFTDGASESDGHTIGGVVYVDEQFEYFSCAVPERLVEEWGSIYSHFIGLVELYAILVSTFLWSDHLCESRAIYFIDNNSSMDACIRGDVWVKTCPRVAVVLGENRRKGQVVDLVHQGP